MRRLKIILPCVFVLLVASGILWNHMNNQSFDVTFYQMSTTKNIKDLRIVELSDLHLAQFGENNNTLVDKVAALKPDLIAVVGDMTMEDNPDHSIAISLTERLAKIAPTYYSAGNHEYTDILHNEKSTLIQDITNAGAVYLDDAYQEAKIGYNKLIIVGVCKRPGGLLQYQSTRDMMERLSQEKEFKLFLSHYPELFISDMEGFPMDLALCGHAHGGWARIPGIGGVYAPDQGLFPKYTEGMRELCGSQVVISRGLGNSHIIPRINNAPELVVIDVN